MEVISVLDMMTRVGGRELVCLVDFDNMGKFVLAFSLH